MHVARGRSWMHVARGSLGDAFRTTLAFLGKGHRDTTSSDDSDTPGAVNFVSEAASMLSRRRRFRRRGKSAVIPPAYRVGSGREALSRSCGSGEGLFRLRGNDTSPVPTWPQASPVTRDEGRPSSSSSPSPSRRASPGRRGSANAGSSSCGRRIGGGRKCSRVSLSPPTTAPGTPPPSLDARSTAWNGSVTRLSSIFAFVKYFGFS